MDRTICSRCSQPNESRARFCANCGLDLVTTARPISANQLPRRGASAGKWLVILMISGAMLLAATAFCYRASSAGRHRRVLAPSEEIQETTLSASRSDTANRRFQITARPRAWSDWITVPQGCNLIVEPAGNVVVQNRIGEETVDGPRRVIHWSRNFSRPRATFRFKALGPEPLDVVISWESN